MRKGLIAWAALAGLLAAGSAARADDVKVALIYGRTGPLEAYAKQTETGFKLGLEYATKGTMEVDGRKIVVITKDDQGKPDLAKSALTEAYRGRRRRHRHRHDVLARRRSRCCRSPRSTRRS